MLSVDDLGEDFRLTAQTVVTISPMRVCDTCARRWKDWSSARERAWEGGVHVTRVTEAGTGTGFVWVERYGDRISSNKCVHELFEEQVAKTPEAVAVVYEDQQLTYGELNRRSNRLAHYLRELGYSQTSEWQSAWSVDLR